MELGLPAGLPVFHAMGDVVRPPTPWATWYVPQPQPPSSLPRRAASLPPTSPTVHLDMARSLHTPWYTPCPHDVPTLSWCVLTPPPLRAP